MTRDQKRRAAWIAQLNSWKVSLRLTDGSSIDDTQVTAVDERAIVCTRGGKTVDLERVISIDVYEGQRTLL